MFLLSSLYLRRGVPGLFSADSFSKRVTMSVDSCLKVLVGSFGPSIDDTSFRRLQQTWRFEPALAPLFVSVDSSTVPFEIGVVGEQHKRPYSLLGKLNSQQGFFRCDLSSGGCGRLEEKNQICGCEVGEWIDGDLGGCFFRKRSRVLR
ncbi:hypothetical protein DY000_02037984 [Brassica cretica]|uniref:Uncharacterized protein n=1 Tax=Brassica cretica TaxID=69181 RepID=A0ABQ7BF19_BRACR|nr:hypothetical protein DY000_02037984 [Brassica cretica]